jgi:dolichol-phosphate mannosyltransferase
MITGMKIHGCHSRFYLLQKKSARKINLDRIKFIGYAFQIEMKYRAYCKNFQIVEVPIIFTDRTKGQSKMSNSIIIEAVFGVIALRIKKLFNTL